jgi:L-lactate dehydrogenase (cytochrome)
MDLHHRFPALSDLKARARTRIPHFAWEYLDSATGDESTQRRNRAALDRVLFTPGALRGEPAPDLTTRLMGRDYPVPWGIAPVGMSGLFWPDAERTLARLAGDLGIPYGLSTVAAQPPEAVGALARGQGWFQLYPPRAADIRADMLRRARDAGFGTLILTVDAPVASRRERQTRGGVTHPPRITPRTLTHILRTPAWALGTLRHGMPRLRFVESYTGAKGALPSTAHVGHLIRTAPDWDYLRILRAEWDGPFVVKGILDPADAVACRVEGVDAVWVSNHAGRQFAGAPASLDALMAVRAAVGPDYPLILDGGIEGGLDVIRAIACGADFVMLGRAWHHGLAAAGAAGARHVHDILTADVVSNLGQLGVGRPDAATARLWSIEGLRAMT